ncbi:PH and SEC7 domain-containing protein isoform X2 [Diabrotica virgifera virgifera]|uniref:Exchange factor for Arf-6 n=1 Tax=Diabrotica virgifera virgifera TaxID=50390 RepID=A0ABM5KHN9_DIAVI|nr:PH and SEC7 domain-containing protein isoform X2 [Diabrotica virgifera virgifera]
MAEELLVVLNRSENAGFGFSLLGEPGLPPIIYNILDDSPAAESGEVEVGDVILKVNETDVIRFSTKEVLKCLRLSADPVILKIKRDPKIKASVRKHLLSTSGDIEKPSKLPAVHTANITSFSNLNSKSESAAYKTHNAVVRHGSATNGSCSEREPLLHHHDHDEVLRPLENEQHERLQWQPLAAHGNETTNKSKSHGQPKFEAYMMTGEHILNISRMPQTTAIVPKQQKKMDNLRYHNSHAHHLRHQQHNSVPNSPNESDLGHRGSNAGKSGPNSASTSPISANKRDQHQPSPADPYNFVRTSRSEDQLQGQNDLYNVSVANSEADEDVTSSLNTLLDTRPDSVTANCNSDSDRIVWTYNAPISDQQKFAHALSNGSSSSHSNVSPTSSSPLHSSGSPASPTSVSSSVMSSHSGSKRTPYGLSNGPMGQLPGGGDYSVSEAVSNISSPDYHDDDIVGLRDCVMEISDHSDSDSTLLVSEPRQRHVRVHNSSSTGGNSDSSDHRIVIQVKGPDKDRNRQSDSMSTLRGDNDGYQMSNDMVQEFEHEEDGFREITNKSSPLSSEDESDVESLHSFHYSPKAVDMPSAIRLAKRLYGLDGFKKSDVSRHLSKNNDFSRAVAEEYLKYFDFERDTLDIALRKFLKQFSLTGETQERERVLVHFSKRYLDCNPGSFNSQDAVHTLTCAIMLLNTDIHGQNVGRKMTCNEFIENLAGLNECENFPRDVLKQLYHAIKNYPLEWALDEESEDRNSVQVQPRNTESMNLSGNPFLEVPISANAVEYKKGYVMRKCCYEANAKRTPFHKRSWKMFYCTLRDLVLYLHKDENGFRKNQMGDNLHNAIRIHHALATKASDYTKKQYVFRLQTADQAEYLFQTSDSKELQSWIDTINFVCASFSAPPLEAAVGSQKKFQRPLLPCSHTKLTLREQLADHEERVMRLGAMLDDHRRSPPEKGSKSQVIQNYKEKEAYLTYELKRYKTYSLMLRSKMSHYPELTVSLVEHSIGEVDESLAGATGPSVCLLDNTEGGVVAPPLPDRPSPTVNRCSFTLVHIIYYPDDKSMLLRDRDDPE